MLAADLSTVERIADVVHRAFPEDPAVLAEKLALYPAGGRILATNVGGGAGEAVGYALSHPWSDGVPPLNRPLVRLPDPPAVYYLHDVALLPGARQGGAGSALVQFLLEQAQALGLSRLALVSVHDSTAYWQRHGFQPAPDPARDRQLASYGADARYLVRTLP